MSTNEHAHQIKGGFSAETTMRTYTRGRGEARGGTAKWEEGGYRGVSESLGTDDDAPIQTRKESPVLPLWARTARLRWVLHNACTRKFIP